tara:strand:- start:208 stop:474 length:267 start_codon:yes stop_codon:yes gene_type:complete
MIYIRNLKPVFKRTFSRNINFKPDYKNYPPKMDYYNFGISCYNCILILSILWGFESYNDKMKTIQDNNRKIDELIVICNTLIKRYKTK